MGLVPVKRLDQDAGLDLLADTHLSVPTDVGANAGGEGDVTGRRDDAGADSVHDMALFRHGAMGKGFDHPPAHPAASRFPRARVIARVLIVATSHRLCLRPGCAPAKRIASFPAQLGSVVDNLDFAVRSGCVGQA